MLSDKTSVDKTVSLTPCVCSSLSQLDVRNEKFERVVNWIFLRH
jgi:hypothetical protein